MSPTLGHVEMSDNALSVFSGPEGHVGFLGVNCEIHSLAREDVGVED